MSHVDDTSNPSPTIGVTPSSVSQSRTTSSSSDVVDPSKRLKFNEFGLPIGMNQSKCATRLGSLARTNVPICYRAWKDVPLRYKDTLWGIFKREYPDVRESQKAIFMRKANIAWKKLKYKLRFTFVSNDINKWKEKVPTAIKSEDWEMFCENEATTAQKQLRKRNKTIKSNCKRQTTHNTGRYGYARTAEKWEEANGRPPNRAELWLSAHKRKDGKYAPHDHEFAEKIEALLKVFSDKGEEETLDSGPLYEVFGKENNGSVRCIGAKISKKAILASAFAREMLKEVNVVRNDWMGKVDELKEEIESLKSTFAQFVEDFRSGKFVNVGHDSHATYSPFVETHNAESPTSVPCAHSGTHSRFDDLIPCYILNYKNEKIGIGRKAKIGAVTTVHGYELGKREVEVQLDKILVPSHPVWGRVQCFASTLEDVGVGGRMYWHDDFVPPVDDTNYSRTV